MRPFRSGARCRLQERPEEVVDLRDGRSGGKGRNDNRRANPLRCHPIPGLIDLAESIRSAAGIRSAEHRPPLPGLSLSMGLAQANSETGYMADELFTRADAALYEAKRLGRNRVIIADRSLPPVPESEGPHRHL